MLLGERVKTDRRDALKLARIDAAGNLLSRQPPDQQQALFRHLPRRIHTTFVLRPHERAALERRLARIVWPVI